MPGHSVRSSNIPDPGLYRTSITLWISVIHMTHRSCEGVESNMTAPYLATHWLSKTQLKMCIHDNSLQKPQWPPRRVPLNRWRWFGVKAHDTHEDPEVLRPQMHRKVLHTVNSEQDKKRTTPTCSPPSTNTSQHQRLPNPLLLQHSNPQPFHLVQRSSPKYSLVHVLRWWTWQLLRPLMDWCPHHLNLFLQGLIFF